MNCRTFLFSLLLTGTMAVGVTADPDENARRAEHLAAVREQIEELKQAGPQTPGRSIADVVHLELAGNHLIIARTQPNGPDVASIVLPDGAAHLSRVVLHADPPIDLTNLRIIRLHEQSAVMTHIQAMDNLVGIQLSIDKVTADDVATIQLSASDRSNVPMDEEPTDASIRLSINSDAEALASIEAKHFVELVEIHHQVAKESLHELFAEFRALHLLAGISTADAYSLLLAERPIEPAIRSELEAMVLTLRRDGTKAVPAARARLRELGPAAIRAFQSLHQPDWSPDLSLNADTAIAGLLPPVAQQASSLLQSAPRLFDLLYSDNLDVRRFAAERIGRLVGETPRVDVTKDPYTLRDQIENERKRLAKE